MATQAVVSVVQNGKVILKVVAGCNGGKAPAFAQYLKAALSSGTIAPARIYEIAQKYDLGTTENLVVMSPTSSYHKCEGELNPRYRETFNRPNFNPRWDEGTADHVIIVDLGNK